MARTHHRQVFGAHGTDMRSLFEEMNASLDAYEYAQGEGPGTLAVAAVLYGAATPSAISGSVWREYRLGERLGVDPRANPLVARFTELRERGARFFVCNNSLRGLAIAVANGVPEVQDPVDVVLRRMHENLVHGMTIVPAGVEALNALQEAGYTYLPASL